MPATVAIPDAERWLGSEVVLANVPAPAALAAQVSLQPWEARVQRR